ncbi:MAG: hypothetical protein AAF526_00065 [Pseudomonadota bacterium]
MSASTIGRPGVFPAIDARTITTLIVAGAFATIAFDLFGQFISPLLKEVLSPYFGAKLAPVGLANGVIAKITGLPAGKLGLGHGLHVIAGLIAYPVGYLFVARPLARAVFPSFPWWLLGALYGAVLWVFALYFMAHLIAGNPPFLVRTMDDGGWAFQSITWVALWGHMVFGIVAAGVIWWREENT